MSTRQIKDAKDLSTNELIYFKGHAQATYMSDGTTVEDAINNIEVGSGDSVDLSNYYTKTEIDNKGFVEEGELAIVATSGNYNDLSNKPTIPTAVTESTVSGWGFTKNAGTVTGVKINDTTKTPSNGTVDLGTVITSHQDISGKQDKLVSGTNIKTINGESLIGEGNIEISGGGSSEKQVIEVTSYMINISNMLPNTIYYRTMGCAGVNITSFATSNSMVDEYTLYGFFSSGSGEDNMTMSITLPENVQWANGIAPVVEEGYRFELSILRIGTFYNAVLTNFKPLSV